MREKASGFLGGKRDVCIADYQGVSIPRLAPLVLRTRSRGGKNSPKTTGGVSMGRARMTPEIRLPPALPRGVILPLVPGG